MPVTVEPCDSEEANSRLRKQLDLCEHARRALQRLSIELAAMAKQADIHILDDILRAIWLLEQRLKRTD